MSISILHRILLLPRDVPQTWQRALHTIEHHRLHDKHVRHWCNDIQVFEMRACEYEIQKAPHQVRHLASCKLRACSQACHWHALCSSPTLRIALDILGVEHALDGSKLASLLSLSHSCAACVQGQPDLLLHCSLQWLKRLLSLPVCSAAASAAALTVAGGASGTNKCVDLGR